MGPRNLESQALSCLADEGQHSVPSFSMFSVSAMCRAQSYAWRIQQQQQQQQQMEPPLPPPPSHM